MFTYGILYYDAANMSVKARNPALVQRLRRDYASSYNENPAIFERGRRHCPYHLNMIMHKNDDNRLRENVLRYLLCNILSLRALCMSDTTLFIPKP